jgi:outer membrane lipoprotein-sorting protein
MLHSRTLFNKPLIKILSRQSFKKTFCNNNVICSIQFHRFDHNLKIIIMKKICFLLMLSVCSFSIAKAQTAQEIINQYIENIGGLDNWKKIEGIKTSAKVNAQGMEIPLEMIDLKNGKKLIKMELQGKEIVQLAFDGNTAWSHNFMTMQAEKTDNETTENIKKESADFPDPFIDYAAKGYKIELVGKETVEGTECHKIKLTKKPQLVDGKEEENVTFYYFDTESVVPILAETEIKSGPAKGMVSQSVFSDYQEVNGLYFPFSITQKAKGYPQGQTINTTKIEINPKVDDAIFKFVESK